MITRPFTTYEQQIQKLKERNMSFNTISENDAKKVLQHINYYKLINGYKEFFTNDDNYHGVEFEDLYTLYKFDEKLRFIFLKAILIFECELKSIVSYVFSQNFSPYSYNKIECFSFATSHQGKDVVQKLISKICKPLTDYPLKTTIKHYITDKKEQVPLWVLTGVLTFGNMVYFYKCLNPNEQRIISNNYDLTSKQFTKIIGFLNYIRNLAAHSERLFDTSFHKNQDKTFNAIIDFKKLLHNDDKETFVNEIIKELQIFKSKNIRCYNIVLSSMKFPKDYEKDLQQ